MSGLLGLIARGAELGEVIDFLSARFSIVSRPHVPSVPYHWWLRCYDDDRLRLIVMAGSGRDGRWFYDVLPVR